MGDNYSLLVTSENPLIFSDFNKIPNPSVQYLAAIMLQSAINKKMDYSPFPSLNIKKKYKIELNELYTLKKDICKVLTQYVLLPNSLWHNEEAALNSNIGIESMLEESEKNGFINFGEEELSFKPTDKLLSELMSQNYIIKLK
ncbi:MAG: hypothetical protein PHN56_07045 [Candidatus Nanoarchaeia archaeon]|nr:hypothetical protein [Candidatus Nanoarchaeia archaeon]